MRQVAPLNRKGFPTAETIGLALVLASIDTCELSHLVQTPADAVAGRRPGRYRWIAFAALCALHLRADHNRLGQLIGCGDQAIRDAAAIRSLPWWSDASVIGLIAALASGEPLQPLFTPERAYGVMLRIREVVEARGPGDYA